MAVLAMLMLAAPAIGAGYTSFEEREPAGSCNCIS